MTRTKVVLNRKAWGANVMSGPGVTSHVAALGEAVASKLDGDTEVELIVAAVQGGGSRVRARVSHGTNRFQEANTNDLVSALSSVLPLARS